MRRHLSSVCRSRRLAALWAFGGLVCVTGVASGLAGEWRGEAEAGGRGSAVGSTATARSSERGAALPDSVRAAAFRDSLSNARDLIKRGQYADAEALAQRLLAGAEATADADSQHVADVLDVLVEALRRGGKGKDPGSRQLAERAVRIREQTLGPDHPDVAGSVTNLANVLIDAGDYAGARLLYERALAIREKALGPNHPDVATSLNNLANLLRVTGDYAGARPLLERALAIREETLGPHHPDVATSLNSLANLLRDSGDYARARPLYERALAIREKVLGPDHPTVATNLTGLANLLSETGDFAGARSLYERALAIREKALGPNHPDVATSLNNLANLLRATGDYAGARPMLERALAIREEALGPDHVDVAASLSNLATLLLVTGDYAGARLLYERALTIHEKALGPDHPNVGKGMYNLAIVLYLAGDYAGSRPLYERALAIHEKTLGPDHPIVARNLSGLASLLLDTGDYAGARPFFERALAIHEKTLGPDHTDVALDLNNLANLLTSTGDYAGARPLYERALAIQEKALGPDHPDVADHLTGLASLLAESNDYTGARPLYERALAIDEKALGSDHPHVADRLTGLASLLMDAGDYAGARPLYERALAIREKALGGDHPNVATALSNLAEVDWALGRSAAALEAALRAEQIGREHLRLTARVLAERQALRYAAVRVSGLDLALSLLGQLTSPESKRTVFDAVIRSRALVLDEMAARHHGGSYAKDPALAKFADRMLSASTRYANLVVRGPDAEHPEGYPKLLDEARQEKENAERALAEKSVAFRQEQAKSRIGLAEIGAALPPGSALLSFVHYVRTDSSAIRATPSGAHAGKAVQSAARAKPEPISSYLAFVLLAGKPEAITASLGAATEVDSLISRWKDAAAAGAPLKSRTPQQSETAYRTAGEALRRRVWDPIAPHLRGANRVFVVPDGSLNLVSLASLPVGTSEYLIEQGPLLHYLSAERDLVPAGGEAAGGQGLLALGGADFDHVPSLLTATNTGRSAAAQTSLPAAASPSYRGERSGCGDLRGLRFALLPGSLREVEDVASLWTKRGVGGRSRSGVTKLTGVGAAEAAFKGKARGQRVLHLATHGFFLGGRCPSALDRTRGIGGLATASRSEPPPVTGDNPLLLSGLALAGANQREQAGPGQDDGILTAEEIAALDLSGVDWAVLSACETGVGEVRAGEGVFGLRRAFQVAGAKTLIMSLWAVEDESARQWMKHLYTGRLVKRLGTAEAVREASLAVLRERRARGESTHPFYWGAFVAAGDWR